MTLPFRRRHHDNEGAHDRARALTSAEMLERLSDGDAAWLAGHLDDCVECRRDREAYLADRELLRSLRDRAPEPPRDLWARTSAALDREARHRPARAPRAAAAGSARTRFPIAPAAALLVLLVVVGASVVPAFLQPRAPSGTLAAVASPPEAPTPIPVAADKVGWVHQTGDGSWELVISNVDAVCTRTQTGCGELGGDVHGRPLALGNTPASMTISPDEHQLVVESLGQGAAPNQILVVPVPTASPTATSAPASSATDTAAPTSPATTPSAAAGTPNPSPIPSSDIAPGSIAIASGVTLVGETAYSDNGQWLAFSAQPSDGSTGPDLYLWKVGDPAAIPVTADHHTYFSAWLGNRILASTVIVKPDLASPDPSAAAADATAAPDPTTDPSGAAASGPTPSTLVGDPSSFLLDPATLARTDLAQPDVWLPVVDPTGHFVTYWSGTLTGSQSGHDWHPATGQVVLDGWSSGSAPAASADAATATPAVSSSPEATPQPEGPAGVAVPVVDGKTGDFTSKFDPDGTHLAIWVAEDYGNTVGRLYLYVIDPTTGLVDQSVTPLRGAPALQAFSLESGRLAWVSPPGQDGQESSVQVLGWSQDNFGEIRTIPSKELFIVH